MLRPSYTVFPPSHPPNSIKILVVLLEIIRFLDGKRIIWLHGVQNDPTKPSYEAVLLQNK